MRKFLSAFLASLMVICLTLCPAVQLPAAATDSGSYSDESIINNFDDPGVYYKKGDWNYWTRYSDAGLTNPIDSGLSYSAFANGTFLDTDGVGGSRAFRFNSASQNSNSYPVALRIYNSGAADKGIFVPEKNATYRIKLKYKVPEICTWTNLYLNVDGIKATGGAFAGTKLARVAAASNLDSSLANTWLQAETTFNVGNTDYEGLGLFFVTTNSAAVDSQLLIDDIEISRVVSSNSTVNNFDDSGIYYKKGDWNYWTRYSDAALTDAIDGELKYTAFANGSFPETDGVNGSRAFSFNNASESTNGYPVALRIYDSGSADKTVFIPEKNATYRIKLKYKVPEICTWTNLYLNMNGMITTDGAFAGTKLVTVVTPSAIGSDSANKWLEAEASFNIGDSNYECLGLFFATSNGSSVSSQLLIDDIEISKVIPSDSIINTFDDEGVYYKCGEWNYWTRYFDTDLTKPIDAELKYSAFANGSFPETDGINGSRAFSFNNASESTNAYPVALRIYDSSDAEKGIFVPARNTTYRVTLKYKVPAIYTGTTLNLNMNGMTTKAGAFAGTKLVTVATPSAIDAASANTWLEAKATFTTGGTAYEGLGLFFTTSGSQSASTQLLLDDIQVQKLDHLNTQNGYSDVMYAVGDSYEDLAAIPNTAGLNFGGWYFDEACSVKATGLISADMPVWAKWMAPAVVDFDTVKAADSFDMGWVKNTHNDTNTLSYDGSSALQINEYGGTGWTRRITLTDSDGTQMKTIPGHSYQVRFSVKETWRDSNGDRYTYNSYGSNRSIYLSNYLGNIATWKDYCFTDSNGKQAVAMLLDYSANTGWVDFELNFTEKSSSANPVVINFYKTFVGVLIDNFSIVDTTMIDTVISSTANDVNRDGSFDVKDMIRIKKMLIGATPINDTADIYKEADTISVDANDLASVRKLLLGAAAQ